MEARGADCVVRSWGTVSTIAASLRREVHVWACAVRGHERTVRRLLTQYARQEPLAWRLGPYGKPYLVGSRLRFNLSHGGDWCLLAVARGTEIGIDIERHRTLRLRAAWMRRCLTQEETRALIDSPDAELLRYWTVKEAMVKAIGRGIGYGLRKLSLGRDRWGEIVLRRLRGEAGPAGRWQVAAFDWDTHHVAALAYVGDARSVRFFTLGAQRRACADAESGTPVPRH